MATAYSKLTPEQKAARQIQNKEWKKRNPEKAAAYKRKHYLQNRETRIRQESTRARMKRYGLTDSQYEKMLEEQGGRCLICQSEVPDRRGYFGSFAIDHDHQTGVVRGLLCIKCNSCLGWYEANADRVTDYLLRSVLRRTA